MPDLSLTPINGEPRIHDLLLAAKLGFDRPRDIRKIIKRNASKLLKFGGCATVERVVEGNKTTEYYLNQKQAVFICMKSETEKAFDVQAEIVRTFDAYLVGDLQAKPKPTEPTLTALATHTRRDVQVNHSKLANAVMIALGGKQRVIQYNFTNVLFQSGKTPAQWKQIGKDEGLKAHRRTSGKEVLRAKHPHIACGLSLSDHLVAGGANETDSISIGKDAQPIFKRILALGMTPAELLI